MIVSISQSTVLLLAIAVLAMSAWGIFKPAELTQLVRSVMDKSWGMYFAVAVRLVLGAALIIAAPASRLPLIFTALGWFALLAAIVISFIGHDRVLALLGWFERGSTLRMRVWLLFGLLFGAFLIYGVT